MNPRDSLTQPLTRTFAEKTNCLITGVGGQGTVLAARVIGTAAMAAGFDVRGSETIGMAQRGGSVTSHVRMGKDIASPLIPLGRADVILAFEPGEALRAIDFLKPGGVFVVCDRPIIPAVKGDYDGSAAAAWLKEHTGAHFVSGEDIIKNCGARSVNIALLGAAAALGAFPFGFNEIEAALAEKLDAKFLAMNIAALRYGAAITGK
ncbi:MAG: indolepyruvate oxidoreductase subunit beta [Acidobacteriota bacterium]|jgi:indolepyruvate ferredoxin oxidoreductase beta subunit|nr:indolepyruvate oxidoreductase subunit beta [Acidobacteriota bacterium]